MFCDEKDLLLLLLYTYLLTLSISYVMNFQKIIDCIAEAFSVFDFSYIISGGLTFFLLLVDLIYIHDVTISLEGTFYKLVLAIFLSYVCGLIVWVMGRSLRAFISDKDEDYVNIYKTTLLSLGTSFQVPIQINTESKQTKIDSIKTTYSYMWSWLQTKRNNEDINAKLKLINRYWVMQAVFEGLIGVVIVAFFIGLDFYFNVGTQCTGGLPSLIIDFCSNIPLLKFFLFLAFSIAGYWHLIIILIMFLVSCCLVYLFGHEAKRYARTQIRDLITLYYMHS